MATSDPFKAEGAYAKPLSTLVIASVFTAMIAAVLVQWSVERGIGVSMILFPILYGVAWAVEGWIPFLQTLGWFVVALLLAAAKNASPIWIRKRSEVVDDGLLQKEIETKHRLLAANSIEQFDQLAEVLRRQHRFQTNRLRVFIFSAIIAAIGTALLYADLVQLKGAGESVVVPASWKSTNPENIFLAFPFIFICVAVPLCMLFASYPCLYFAACVAATLYAGTAFCLLFRPSLPDMPVVVPYIVLATLLTGLGLMGEWITADSSHVSEEGPQEQS